MQVRFVLVRMAAMVMLILIGMSMRFFEMKTLSGDAHGINVHDRARQKSQVFQQLRVNLRCNLMGIGNRHFRGNGNIELGQKLVPQPARPDFADLFDTMHMPGGVL